MRSLPLLLAPAALAAGSLMAWHQQSPAWLHIAVAVSIAITAAAFAFTAWCPRFMEWPPLVQGLAALYLGVAVLFVPVQYVASVGLISLGSRLILRSTFARALPAPRTAPAGTELVRARTGIERREPWTTPATTAR